MAWWQKRLLQYALSRTGLLDDDALDLKNLDVTLGRRNVVELKDVGLNIKRISKLAQLPPELRIETARVLSLRLTVPADILQSGIIAEADGLELNLRLDEKHEDGQKAQQTETKLPSISRTPQHRKVHRRIPSPPPSGPGRRPDIEDVHLPTTEELAKSFLLEEPVTERRQLEASVAVGPTGLEESVASESSEGDDLGTGAAMGLPSFLAGFLQGIADRFKVKIKNVEANLQADVPGDGHSAIPVTLQLKIGGGEFESVSLADGSIRHASGQHQGRRVKLEDLSLNLLSDAAIFSELSEMPAPSSPSESRQRDQSPLATRTPTSDVGVDSSQRPTTSSTHRSFGSVGNSGRGMASPPRSPDAMRESIMTADSDRFADAGDSDIDSVMHGEPSDLEIQPGDDNVSWGSRRSQSDAPAGDLWESMVSEDELPESLILKPAPRVRSSRDDSPASERDHPSGLRYVRGFQSPGSWPRLDRSPERHRSQKSPGSWPTLDQSQHSVFQPFTPANTAPFEDATDNKRAALEASAAQLEGFETPPEPSANEVDDLAQSRIFSHEEAQSMYMSAMTSSPRMHVPGGWGAESTISNHSPSGEEIRYASSSQGINQHDNSHFDDDLAYGEQPYQTPSGNVTPRAASPAPISSLRPPSKTTVPKTLRQLVYLDVISIWTPIPTGPAQDQVAQGPLPRRNATANDIPGTFSAYSDLAASRRGLATSFREDSHTASHTRDQQVTSTSADSSLQIDIGILKCQADIPCSRLMYRLAGQAKSLLDSRFNSTSRHSSTTIPEERTGPYFSIAVQGVRISLREVAGGDMSAIHATDVLNPSLVTFGLGGISCAQTVDGVDVRIQTFESLLGSSHFVSFNRSEDMKTSMIISEQTPDIACIVTKKTTVTNRHVTDISFETLPLDFLIDLQTIDATFESYGGLSGVLELGNSILSESGLNSSPTSPTKSGKGVRFEGDPHYIGANPEIKVNGRIGGVCVTLHGSLCYVQLRTTTLKAVYREQGASATIEQILITGPHLASGEDHLLSIDLSTLRLEYLVSPQEKDLDRLLSLLTPSKDKYDNDDDILIDTLLRQRRKGAVLRTSFADVKFKCQNWDRVTILSTLASEVGKLSAVAKYLPEDERPGLLTLIRIRGFEASLPVNERFGQLFLRASDLHCAQIGLPALLALSVGTFEAFTEDQAELFHPLMPPATTDGLPMMMARMLGDEVEPTIKIKIFNLCVEYSVPVILALTGLDKESDAEELVAEMTKSVAAIALPQDRNATRIGPGSDVSTSSKKTKVDILVHDSAIGLMPQKLSSKGLVVVTDAVFSTTLPTDDSFMAKLELRKAGVFLADQVLSNAFDGPAGSRGSPSNTATKAKLALHLSKYGYVSVGSTRSAMIIVNVNENIDAGTTAVEIDVRNDLLLLETCADSTQTLIATLNGLTPPTPPSKQPKYLTEPMTIEDMMASFTGDPFVKPEEPPEKLFDVEEEPDDDPDMMLDVPTLYDGDGLLAESEMTSSLYGPVSGMLGGVDEIVEDDGDDDYAGTVESLLEDDPFEMPNSPTDAGLNDNALMRELYRQCKPARSDEKLDLGLYEIEDLGFDALGRSQGALGTQYRFNAPTSRPRVASKSVQQEDVPFKLRLRDLHIIWNLYDGYDWQRTRDGITEAVEQVETRAEERKARRRQSLNDRDEDDSVIEDFLFNSIYIGVANNTDAQELRRQINRGIDELASETESVPMSGMSRPTTAYSSSGRPIRQRQKRRLKLERSKMHKISFELKGVSADILVLPPDNEDVSSVDLRIRDFEIFDQVPTSTWRKFLTQLNNDPASREMSKPIMHIEILNVRTLKNYSASEILMHVSILPLRLHVDQDALDFITRFFEFKDESAKASESPEELPFIQRVEIDTVDVCLDYKPKKVDYGVLRSGHTSEFMNFMILDGANIKLRHAMLHGLRGFEPLHPMLKAIWTPDVIGNQLPTVLAGLAPVRSLVNIGSGLRDVVAIPMKEYTKDGRIVRSIQKGAFQFGKTTTSELARLGAKVAMGTQNLLSGAEGFLTPTSSSPGPRTSDAWNDTNMDDPDEPKRTISAYANQPMSVLSGLRSARRYLEYDLLTARDAFIAVQGEVLESSSPGSAAAAVVRHAPTIVLRPIIGTSRAVGTALLGVGNQIDRRNMRNVDDVSIYTTRSMLKMSLTVSLEIQKTLMICFYRRDNVSSCNTGDVLVRFLHETCVEPCCEFGIASLQRTRMKIP